MTATAIRAALALPGITLAAAPSAAAAAPAGPSAVAADNHQTPRRLHPGLCPRALPPLSRAKTERDPGCGVERGGRPTRPASPLCVRCGTPAQETSPLAPQAEGMCLPAD